MEITLNFKVDEPTVNGRVYPKELFESAMNRRMQDDKTMPLYGIGYDATKPLLKDIIGVVKSYNIKEDGTITAEVKPTIDEEMFNLMMSQCIVTSSAIGDFNEDKVMTEVNFRAFYLAPNDVDVK